LIDLYVYGVMRAPAAVSGVLCVEEAGLVAIYREVDVDALERHLADESPAGRV
jgi:hypothetical protein